MAKKVSPIPKGYHSVTPSLVISGAKEAIEFYKKAFLAEKTFYMERPDGKVMHAVIKIGDSILMLADECPPHQGHEVNCPRSPENMKGSTVSFYLYVNDVDAVFDRAVNAGAKAIMPVSDMFWGDRMGTLRDPFGHFWMVATQKEFVNQEQLRERAEKFFKEPPPF